ncbi:MAG: hypothetical protein WCL39_15545 [Armatimonadota bacterium]
MKNEPSGANRYAEQRYIGAAGWGPYVPGPQGGRGLIKTTGAIVYRNVDVSKQGTIYEPVPRLRSASVVID